MQPLALDCHVCERLAARPENITALTTVTNLLAHNPRGRPHHKPCPISLFVESVVHFAGFEKIPKHGTDRGQQVPLTGRRRRIRVSNCLGDLEDGHRQARLAENQPATMCDSLSLPWRKPYRC